jgi:hypothetical protein
VVAALAVYAVLPYGFNCEGFGMNYWMNQRSGSFVRCRCGERDTQWSRTLVPDAG